jgi:hypothetical protein
MRLRDLPSIPMYDGGWILLGERPGEEIALGFVGKFWRPVIEFAPIEGPEKFREFNEPGFAKTVYALSARELAGGRTQLAGVMRTATTDEHARRWFRRYWTFGIGSGAPSSRWCAARIGTAQRGETAGGATVGVDGGLVKKRSLRPLEAARAFGLMLGGSMRLIAFLVGGLAAVIRSAVTLRGGFYSYEWLENLAAVR